MESSQPPQGQGSYQPQYTPQPVQPPKEGMDTTTKLAIIIIIVMVITGSIGAYLLIRTIDDDGILGDYQFTEYFETNYDVNNNTIIEVSTVNGHINIVGTGGGTLHLEGLKKSHFLADLDDVNLDVAYVGNKIIFTVEFETTLTTGEAIDLDLSVPSYVTIDSLESVNGAIDVRGMLYMGDVENVNAAITVRLEQMHRDIVFENVNGDISVYVFPAQDVIIELTTVNGDINIDNDLVVSLIKDTNQDKEGHMGAGGHDLSVHTVNGDIFLRRAT